ncbi:MAG TPA: hypothetical protein VF718_06535 [Allosphingosinicella sp.]|jgi:hypothetical protein
MTGAERAQTEPETGATGEAANDWLGAPVDLQAPEPASEPERARRPARAGLLGALLILLALGWVAAVGYWLWQTRPPVTLGNGIAWTATLAGPLALLALAWLLFGRTSRREAERFRQAVETMAAESRALESVLEIVAGRIEDNHGRLRGEAERLMSLGDEASDRLGRVTYYLSKETATLDQKAAALDSAAAAAKVDIGVLLHDLPRAEEQARAVAEAMKQAGLNAHGQASALEAQLASLAARGRDADEVLGGAAQRMSAHVARIESGSAAAAASLDESSAKMTAAVDGAMSRAAEAVEQARAALELQGSTTLAAIEQSRAALDKAGEDSARNLAQRIETISGKIEAMAGHIAAQDAASHALVTGLGKELAELDSWFEQLARTGGAQSERLGASVAAVRASAAQLLQELGAGQQQASGLIESAGDLGTALAGIGGELREQIPAALREVEEQAGRTREAAAAIVPLVGEVAKTAEAAAAGLGESERAVGRSREAVEALLGRVAEGSAEAGEQLRALGAAAEEARAAGQRIAAETGESVAEARTAAAALVDELGTGQRQADGLIESAGELASALRGISGELSETLPAALRTVEEQAGRTREAAEAIVPLVGDIASMTDGAAVRLGESEASLSRQQDAIEALLARIGEGSATAGEQLSALGAAAEEARASAQRIAAETGPELIEALLRVREAAGQASERAREAISAAIPASAAALGEASREALQQAVSETVERQMAELSAVSERAIETARRASERLTRQMLSLGETAAAIEARIDQERAEREEKDSENFSRRVALLIESLNSTAIDVTKILSNEVTDSAWTAYLKGDRGVFTRRAVRLLDRNDAREIARHYEEEPEFREQVNRYIHDFEAMLRRIFADRDGSPLGVTILSSDMGKLYVALAQAIERIR